MALSPISSACFRDNCKTIRSLDNTGIYSVSTNTGGWGSPNTSLVDANPVTMIITLADETTSEDFNLTSTVNAATIIDSKFLLRDFTMADFGGLSSDQFDDGIINIVYIVTDVNTGTEYTYEANIWNDCKIKCCLAKALIRVEKELCECDFTTFWHQYNLISMNLASARYAFGNGDFTKAKKYLKAMQKSCKIINCSCN